MSSAVSIRRGDEGLSEVSAQRRSRAAEVYGDEYYRRRRVRRGGSALAGMGHQQVLTSRQARGHPVGDIGGRDRQCAAWLSSPSTAWRGQVEHRGQYGTGQRGHAFSCRNNCDTGAQPKVESYIRLPWSLYAASRLEWVNRHVHRVALAWEERWDQG